MNLHLNIKVGSIKNETISARGNSYDEKDALKNYSTNIHGRLYIYIYGLGTYVCVKEQVKM